MIKDKIYNILQTPIISQVLSKKLNKNLLIENRKIALQKYGFDTIKTIDSALTKNQILYFADFGTLLGIVRENGFIKHDLDMDFGIIENQHFSWSKLEKLMLANNILKVRQFIYKGIITEQTYRFENLTIDFFLHFRDDKNDFAYEYYKQKKYPYKSNNEFSVAKWNLYKFDNIERRRVNEIEINIPCDPEKYLESIYSTNWRIPNARWKSCDGQGWTILNNEIATMVPFD
ncbi:MAG: hypothetical protein J6B49_02430 [Phascolarctobacterium sp.]|nr:hypothetical protein [Phascolarctobacterium sp.]